MMVHKMMGSKCGRKVWRVNSGGLKCEGLKCEGAKYRGLNCGAQNAGTHSMGAQSIEGQSMGAQSAYKHLIGDRLTVTVSLCTYTI